jgi:centrosomal protein CEP104
MGEISKMKQQVADKDNVTFEEMMQMDEVTLEKVKVLKAAKEKAIKMEDYDEAKRLKETIERLRSMGTHLAQLEERKKIAIENEDFDAAKIIKIEIDRLRTTALEPAYNNGPYSDQQKPEEVKRPFSGGPDAPLADEMPPQRKPRHDVFGSGPNITEKMGGMSMDELEPSKKPSLPIHKKDVFGSGPGRGPKKGVEFPSDNNFYEEEKKMAMPRSPPMPEDIDEQVIPAARNRGGPPEDGGIIASEEGGPSEAEDITGEDIKIAQPLIPVFGENTIKKLFSKNWANRENAILETEEVFNSNPDPDTVTAALGVAAQGIKDKIGQVVLRTFDLLTSILASFQNPAPGDANFYIDDVIANLCNRVGDNNARIREKALEIGIELSAHPMAGHSLVIDHLSRKVGKKGASQSVRQLAGKYKLLSEILVNTPVTKPNEQRN